MTVWHEKGKNKTKQKKKGSKTVVGSGRPATPEFWQKLELFLIHQVWSLWGENVLVFPVRAFCNVRLPPPWVTTPGRQCQNEEQPDVMFDSLIYSTCVTAAGWSNLPEQLQNSLVLIKLFRLKLTRNPTFTTHMFCSDSVPVVCGKPRLWKGSTLILIWLHHNRVCVLNVRSNDKILTSTSFQLNAASVQKCWYELSEIRPPCGPGGGSSSSPWQWLCIAPLYCVRPRPTCATCWATERRKPKASFWFGPKKRSMLQHRASESWPHLSAELLSANEEWDVKKMVKGILRCPSVCLLKSLPA